MAQSFTLLLGKPPRPGTLLAEVAEDLTAHGAEVTVRLPHEQSVEAEELVGQSLVAHRGLRSSVSPLLTAAQELGVELCNPRSADALLRDRRSWHAALDRAGIPVPPSVTVNRWDDVLDQAGTEHVVAKALAGPGRGVGVVTGNRATLPGRAPFPGPYLLEPRLVAEDTDRKLYVAGEGVRGLLKPSTLEHPHAKAGEPFTPGAALVDLAVETGRVLGAHLLGVDVLDTSRGPVVVDVNGFPGFRGVAGAPALVADHLRAHASRSGPFRR